MGWSLRARDAGDHETRTHPPGRHTGVLLDLDLAAEAHRLRNRRRCAVNDRARRNPIITGPFTVWHFGHRCIVVLLVVVLAERCVLETLNLGVDPRPLFVVPSSRAMRTIRRRSASMKFGVGMSEIAFSAELTSAVKLSPILRLHPEVRLPRHVDVFRVDGGLRDEEKHRERGSEPPISDVVTKRVAPIDLARAERLERLAGDDALRQLLRIERHVAHRVAEQRAESIAGRRDGADGLRLERQQTDLRLRVRVLPPAQARACARILTAC